MLDFILAKKILFSIIAPDSRSAILLTTLNNVGNKAFFNPVVTPGSNLCKQWSDIYAGTLLIFQAILMGIGLQHKTMEDLEVAICLCTKMDIAE